MHGKITAAVLLFVRIVIERFIIRHVNDTTQFIGDEMRNLEITFSELWKYLENRGEVFEEGEYIYGVSSQVAYPDRTVFVSVDGPRIGLNQMTTKE